MHWYYPNYDMLSVFGVGQINAFLKRPFENGFFTKMYTIGVIAEEADKLLFKTMMSANHCRPIINFLLPSVKSRKYCFRPKGHAYELLRCEIPK